MNRELMTAAELEKAIDALSDAPLPRFTAVTLFAGNAPEAVQWLQQHGWRGRSQILEREERRGEGITVYEAVLANGVYVNVHTDGISAPPHEHGIAATTHEQQEPAE